MATLDAPSFVEARDRMVELESAIESSERGVISKMTMRGQSDHFLPFARNGEFSSGKILAPPVDPGSSVLDFAAPDLAFMVKCPGHCQTAIPCCLASSRLPFVLANSITTKEH